MKVCCEQCQVLLTRSVNQYPAYSASHNNIKTAAGVNEMYYLCMTIYLGRDATKFASYYVLPERLR